MLNLTKVRTPDLAVHIDQKDEVLPLRDLQVSLKNELNRSKKWSDKCTKLLTSNLHALFLYDRIDYAFGTAYGNVQYKILLNPVMALCYHPQCLGNGPRQIDLRHIFDIAYYVEHLENHCDVIGVSMHKRFSALLEDIFITSEDLDEIYKSPYAFQPALKLLPPAKKVVEDYGIHRGHNQVYICHWKSKLISSNIISSSSLTFQEDEALVYSLLQFPHPVHDWSKWGTLSLYCMKLFTYISSAALSIYRGVTLNRISATNPPDTRTFAKRINHPAPSVSTEQRNLPSLNYDNQIFHRSELMFHIKLLMKKEGSLNISFENVVRYLVTCLIDEQEINQGTFTHEGKLYGLKNVMSVADITKIGLPNLAEYISTKNPFISSIREYRLTDFSGFMCSNIFSSFEAGDLNTERCTEQLEKVIEYSKSCYSCLKSNLICKYTRIDEQCEECAKNGDTCTSLIVFHVLWDMGSSHKSTTRSSVQIDLNSPIAHFGIANMHTIGFGGLHLCKASTNAMRNHILTFKGMNYGLNIFRAVKQFSNLLDAIKQAVFVGKDRQSDLLSYLTSCLLVINALTELKWYEVTRVPEPVLKYTANAKTQKDIILPTAVSSNKNGDIFVLDTGASCVHAIDRSVVSKVFLIGKYLEPCYGTYSTSSEVSASNARFSSQLLDMVSFENNLYILDAGRNEVVIVTKVVTAKVTSCQVYIIPMKEGISLAHNDASLIVLQQTTIKFISVNFPRRKKDYKLNVDFQVLSSYKPTSQLQSIFVMKDNLLGAVNSNSLICVYQCSGQKILAEEATNISSKCKPSQNIDGQVCLLDDDQVCAYEIDFKNSDLTVKEVGKIGNVVNTLLVHAWGKVIYIVTQGHLNSHTIVEVGPLEFAIQICRAINDFYCAISYCKPGFGNAPTSLTLSECIEKATPLVNLLKDIQDSLTNKFPTRSYFYGDFGSVCSHTINCIIHTVDSWKALESRLNYFDPGLADKVHSHSINNESLIEHSYGFQKKQGQGQLQNYEEYVQSKRHHSIDFQIRKSDTPFCQYTKTKVRDKGYQSVVDVEKIKLTFRELKEIFTDKNKDKVIENEEVDEEGAGELRKAYLLTKSVPRQSNRAKWRESAGYAPNLLMEMPNIGCLVPGDIVFTRDIEGNLSYFVVKNLMKLLDKTRKVVVTQVGAVATRKVQLGQLLIYKQQIAVVPSNKYTITDGEVDFDANVSEMIQTLADAEEMIYDEDDLEVLMSSNVDIGSGVEQYEEHGSNGDDQQIHFTSTAEFPTSGISKRKVSAIDTDNDDDEDEMERDEIVPLNNDNDDNDDEMKRDEIVPLNNTFYLIRLMNKRSIHHFVGLTDSSKNEGGFYWIQFFKKTDEPAQFTFVPIDSGLVSSEEIVKEIHHPTDHIVSSSRCGRVTFDPQQLSAYSSTLK